MKVSDAVAQYLVHEGVNTIFGYQGGAITHLIDSFDKAGIHYVQTYNEQGASLAADAFARIHPNGLGVAIGTNGPGATNMITGIANAYCDSIPVLFLTGQVHTFAMKQSPEIRQESFQEIEILSVTRSITKYAVTVMDKDEVLAEIKKAIRIAKEGRPGPVLVDLPVDVQGYQIDEELLTACMQDQGPEAKEICPEDFPLKAEECLKLLMEAKRPLIIAGGGVRLDKATELLRQMARGFQIPVVASMMGLDAYPHDDALFTGLIGSYGNRYANIAVQKADVLFVLGSRLDMRQTGKRKDLFASGAKVIHVDVDSLELGHFISEDISICCNISTFLEWLLAHKDSDTGFDRADWLNEIETLKNRYIAEEELEQEKMPRLNPNRVMHHIGSCLPSESIACSDVGQNQLWAAQSLRVSGEAFRLLNSGGLGAMGYSLPAAIGAYYANPKATIVACMGDGGLQMNIQELQVVGQNQLPITIVVMNNHALGLIRDTHEKYYDKRYVGSVWGFSMPELEWLCKAYHLGYTKVCSMDELSACLNQKSFPQKAPLLIEVEFTEDTYVHPELLGPDGIDHQSPYRD